MNSNFPTSVKTRRLDFGITIALIIFTTLAFSNSTRTQELSKASQSQATNTAEMITLK